MTTGGWIIMLTSVTLATCFMLWCLWKVFTVGNEDKSGTPASKKPKRGDISEIPPPHL